MKTICWKFLFFKLLMRWNIIIVYIKNLLNRNKMSKICQNKKLNWNLINND